MAQMQVFVSHSSQDTPFTGKLVAALRAADMDVWWDEHDLGGGHLLEVITREVNARPVFIVVLSKAALDSKFVYQECTLAHLLYLDEPHRVILPVTASAVNIADFRPRWLFMEQFKRIEAPGGVPYPPEETVRRTVEYLRPPADFGPDCVVPPGLGAKELTERGLSLYHQYKYECSIRYCRRATELDPSYASAWYNLAYSLMQVGRSEEALAACDHVIALRPRHSFAWNLRGYILSGLGRHAEQLEATKRALELKPTLARNWGNMAEALTSLRRYEEALAACDSGLAVTPTSEFVRGAKAEVLTELGQYDEALAIYDALLTERHKRQAPHYWSSKGHVLHALGRYQEAQAAHLQATFLEPDAPLYWSRLARTLRALGMRREAQEATPSLDVDDALTQAFLMRDVRRKPQLSSDAYDCIRELNRGGRRGRGRQREESGAHSGDAL
jgi:tetratricopeptide (TPR) repeat protein